jgi:hypothetical protein
LQALRAKSSISFLGVLGILKPDAQFGSEILKKTALRCMSSCNMNIPPAGGTQEMDHARFITSREPLLSVGKFRVTLRD